MMRRGGARASTPIDDGNVMASSNPSLPARTVDDGTVVVTSAEPVVLDAPGPSLAARLGAEAFGTFGLVLVILGASLYLPLNNVGTLGVALFAGLVLAGLIAALGHVSGGHFNPAVSLGAAFSGRLSVADLLLYWVSQVFGAVLAAAILFVTIPTTLPTLLGAADKKAFFGLTANGFGAHSPLSAMSSGQVTFDLKSALIIEVVATAVFVAVTIGVTSRRVATAVGPFAVGITLGAMILVTGPVTGGGVNPARSTAAALFSGGAAIGQLWLFWLAPLLGAAIVGLFALAFAPVAEPNVDDVVVDEDDEYQDDEDDEVERV
jgi:aquaporin Z